MFKPLSSGTKMIDTSLYFVCKVYALYFINIKYTHTHTYYYIQSIFPLIIKYIKLFTGDIKCTQNKCIYQRIPFLKNQITIIIIHKIETISLQFNELELSFSLYSFFLDQTRIKVQIYFAKYFKRQCLSVCYLLPTHPVAC